LWLIQDQAKHRSISDNVTQDLGCVEVEKVDQADCCTAKAGCMILRTVNPIPKPVDLLFEDAIIYVGNVNKKEGYEQSSQVQSYWDQFNKYTAEVPKAYFANGYIYVTVKEFVKYINIKGIFEDPREAANYKHCDGTPCFTVDSNYPVTNKIIKFATEEIMKKELALTISTNPDMYNNANGIPTNIQGNADAKS